MALNFLVEALAHLRDCPEDVDEKPVVRLLIEYFQLRVVVGVKLLPDELEELGHELQLVELVKAG